MNQEMLLSFVIPVYNVEKYLNECLDSIFDNLANEHEYEVIAVDDGSTDNSSEILKTYAHHKNLRIITQGNGGAGVARNTGIKAALGEYLSFVDSDDFLLPGAASVLLGLARESDCDIIEFDHQTTNETSLGLVKLGSESNRDPMSGNGKMLFPQWARQHVFISMVWIRLYKRKLLIDNSLLFCPGIVHEDEEWIYRCFFYADNVVFHPLAIYNYRRREGSISLLSNSNMYKRCNDIFIIIDSLVDFVRSIPNNPENADFIHTMDRVIAYFYRVPAGFLSADWDIAEKEKIICELVKRKYLLEQFRGSKARYLYWFLKIFPPRMALKLYNIIERF